MKRLPSEPDYFKKIRIRRETIKRRRIYFIIDCCFLAVILAFAGFLFISNSSFVNNIKLKFNGIECSVQSIDYDYGKGIYFECGNENALIDFGIQGHSDELLGFVRSRGIDKLDYLLVSDISAEYTEILKEIINTVEITRIVIPKCDEEMYSFYDDFLFKNGKTLWTSEEIGYFSVDKLKFEVIDDETMSLRVVFGETSFLIYNLSDNNIEAEIINSRPRLDSDVLISLNANLPSDKFIETVTPDFFVLNCNSYVDLPTVEKIADKCYSADINGDITIISDEVDIKIKCENN